ncbi:hypothetical protein K439DRAFT_1634875 [Ramaria rubella]|nr:hypothetical protein K439DRAFT_1634875 [Ramaria rubella]
MSRKTDKRRSATASVTLRARKDGDYAGYSGGNFLSYCVSLVQPQTDEANSSGGGFGTSVT